VFGFVLVLVGGSLWPQNLGGGWVVLCFVVGVVCLVVLFGFCVGSLFVVVWCGCGHPCPGPPVLGGVGVAVDGVLWGVGG